MCCGRGACSKVSRGAAVACSTTLLRLLVWLGAVGAREVCMLALAWRSVGAVAEMQTSAGARRQTRCNMDQAMA